MSPKGRYVEDWRGIIIHWEFTPLLHTLGKLQQPNLALSLYLISLPRGRPGPRLRGGGGKAEKLPRRRALSPRRDGAKSFTPTLPKKRQLVSPLLPFCLWGETRLEESFC